MHPEQRANRMYLNKRTNSTEELQLKQDRDLKEEEQKTRDFFIRKPRNSNRNRRKLCFWFHLAVADLLICLFEKFLTLFDILYGFWARYLS